MQFKDQIQPMDRRGSAAVPTTENRGPVGSSNSYADKGMV